MLVQGHLRSHMGSPNANLVLLITRPVRGSGCIVVHETRGSIDQSFVRILSPKEQSLLKVGVGGDTEVFEGKRPKLEAWDTWMG